MKSFKHYLTENDNPFILGRLLKVSLSDDEFTALVVRVEHNVAALLVVTPDHRDCMTIINSNSLSNPEYDIINHRRVPIQSYFYQSIKTDRIKRIEYHEPKKINEASSVETFGNTEDSTRTNKLDEDIERSAVLYFQSVYKRLKNRDATNDKLNLILEIMLTDADDYRIRFL